MPFEPLITICQKNELPLGAEDVERLRLFADCLQSWNTKINLISRKDEEHIFDRHILHSLTLRMPTICDYDFSGARALDLGTGGGLPGIPLAIITPSLDMTLLDSIQKKIVACQSMISELKLAHTRAISGRAEEMARSAEHAHLYDVIVSRAVAPLEDLVKWSAGLLKQGGVLFSLKGGDLSAEVRHAERSKMVRSVEARPLALNGYSEFLSEEKKLVRVDFR